MNFFLETSDLNPDKTSKMMILFKCIEEVLEL